MNDRPLDQSSTRELPGSADETIPPAWSTPAGRTSRPLEPGALFGRYRIVRQLGAGAMGAVYLAEDVQLVRKVALKTPHFEHDPTGELLVRFQREARACAALRHPNICEVYDVGELDGRHYLTMAYIDGPSLSSLVSSDTPPPERKALLLIHKLALALHEAHRRGVVHRDLKPANVMLDKRGEPIVMDFGLARRLDRGTEVRITQSGTLIGSPAYMSPEQIEGDPAGIGPATDQYSLGVMLYELLTGQLPFRGSMAAIMGQIVTREPAPPSDVRPDLDLRIERVCPRMMAKAAAERFPDMQAVAQEVAAILKDPGGRHVNTIEPIEAEPIEAETVPLAAAPLPARRSVRRKVAQPEPTRRSMKRIAWTVGALIVGTFVAAAIFSFRPRETAAPSSGTPSGSATLDAAPPPAPVSRISTQTDAARKWFQLDVTLAVVVPGRGPWVYAHRAEDLPAGGWDVVSVDVTGKPIRDADVIDFRVFPRLEFVRLAGKGITKQALTTLQELPRLAHVHVGGTSVDNAGLAGLPPLQRLNVAYSSVTDVGLKHLQRMPALEFLEVDEHQLTEAGVGHLRSLPSLKKLWCFARDGELRRAATLTNLHELALWRVPGSGLSDVAVSSLAQLKQLERLFLHSDKITDVGLSYLEPLGGLKFLNYRAAGTTASALARLRRALPNCTIVCESLPTPAPTTAESASQLTLVPTGRNVTEWRYTTTRPGRQWFDPDFNDSSWLRGKADFSNSYGGAATKWQSPDIWLRTEFQWKRRPLDKLLVTVKHDDAVQVYLNGEPILQRIGYISEYQTFPVPLEQKSLLRGGRNVLSVHCRNRAGPQFIDVGLSAVPSLAPDSARALK